MGIPNITVTQNVTTISTVVGKDVCTATYQVNENYVEMEARATKNGAPYGRGIGILVISKKADSGGFFPANTNDTFGVYPRFLGNGDGQYRISVYVKNVDGIWSDAIAFTWDSDDAHGWDFGTWI